MYDVPGAAEPGQLRELEVCAGGEDLRVDSVWLGWAEHWAWGGEGGVGAVALGGFVVRGHAGGIGGRGGMRVYLGEVTVSLLRAGGGLRLVVWVGGGLLLVFGGRGVVRDAGSTVLLGYGYGLG